MGSRAVQIKSANYFRLDQIKNHVIKELKSDNIVQNEKLAENWEYRIMWHANITFVRLALNIYLPFDLKFLKCNFLKF